MHSYNTLCASVETKNTFISVVIYTGHYYVACLWLFSPWCGPSGIGHLENCHAMQCNVMEKKQKKWTQFDERWRVREFADTSADVDCLSLNRIRETARHDSSEKANQRRHAYKRLALHGNVTLHCLWEIFTAYNNNNKKKKKIYNRHIIKH